jgi:hypothetical protein
MELRDAIAQISTIRTPAGGHRTAAQPARRAGAAVRPARARRRDRCNRGWSPTRWREPTAYLLLWCGTAVISGTCRDAGRRAPRAALPGA